MVDIAAADTLPEPDRQGSAPHPRETQTLFGQESAESAFLEAFTTGRLHHAWLLTGPRGIGKATLAWRIARFLLATPDGAQEAGLFGDAPPEPRSLAISPDHPVARRVAALSDPSLFLLRRPWDDKFKRLKAEITVDEVRKLHRFFALSAAEGGRRVVIVDAADEMNTAAANALLKVLEEPPARATLLLVAHRPARLLPTIRSRCRTLSLAPLLPDDMAAALMATGLDTPLDPATAALAQGSIGAALNLIESDGTGLYQSLVGLWAKGPLDRQATQTLAETMAGVKGRDRFETFLSLVEHFLARLAKAGVMGPPQTEAAQGEAAVFARLCPHDHAARAWSTAGAQLLDRARHGLGVNLDPASLVLDMLLALETEARRWRA